MKITRLLMLADAAESAALRALLGMRGGLTEEQIDALSMEDMALFRASLRKLIEAAAKH